jgi:hypothetical protein
VQPPVQPLEIVGGRGKCMVEVSRLIDPVMLVEIEAEAIVPE